MRVGGRNEDFVLIECEIAHRDRAPHTDRRAHLILPDQIARARIQRLHNIARIGEKHRALVNDRSRFIRARFIHRPDPLELQVLHIGCRDLRKRTVAPRLIITANHEPVGRIRMPQHLLGDRHVILHQPANGEPARRRYTSASETSAATRTRCRGERHRTRSNTANRKWRCCRQRLAPGRCAIRLQQERSHTQVIGRRNAPRVERRHRPLYESH